MQEHIDMVLCECVIATTTNWSVYCVFGVKRIFFNLKNDSSYVNCEGFNFCGEIETFSYLVIFQIELVLVQI